MSTRKSLVGVGLGIAMGAGVTAWWLWDDSTPVVPAPVPVPDDAIAVVRPPPDPEPTVPDGFCDELEDGGAVSGPDCITSHLACGDEIVGHTLGGVDRFDTRFYEKHFCWPGTVDHDGGDERVYALSLPAGDHHANVTLDSPCAELSLAAMPTDRLACPDGQGARLRRCEMFAIEKRTKELDIVTQGDGETWLVVVEGRGDEEGAFTLSVECNEGLH